MVLFFDPVTSILTFFCNFLKYAPLPVILYFLELKFLKLVFSLKVKYLRHL